MVLRYPHRLQIPEITNFTEKKTPINITCNFQKSAVGSCFSELSRLTAPPTRMKIVRTHVGLSASLKGTMAVTGFLGRKILKHLKGRD